ncbi:High mobility group [Coemansia sp. RSA 2703]|nr:High mobility group [Coemansia sp. RSA 2703]
MNSFLLYSAERRVQLRQTHPDLNTTQQSTILAREWAALQEDEKEKYRAEAKQLRDDYNARRAELSLKLQQQLNQQHLNIGLAQAPPPPSHPSGLDLLDVNMGTNIPDAHMHRVNQFGNSGGFQPHFSGTPGFHMPHSVSFNAATPGTTHIQGHHTPTPSFVQAQHDEGSGYVSANVNSVNMTDPFSFTGSLSNLESAHGPADQKPLLEMEPNVSNTLDFSSSGRYFDQESEKQGINTPADAREAAGSSKRGARLSSPTKRTRKKSKKDPDAPKHPMSAFLYYLTSERPRLAEHLGDMSIGQQTKIIAKQWKTLTESDRAPWEKLAKHDKDRYARERREYHGETRHTDTSVNTN